MKTNEENLMALQPKDPRRPIELTEDMTTAEKLEALQFNTDWLHKALINMAASNQGLFYSTRLRTTANLKILDSLTSEEVEDGESSETENEKKEEKSGNATIQTGTSGAEESTETRAAGISGNVEQQSIPGNLEGRTDSGELQEGDGARSNNSGTNAEPLKETTEDNKSKTGSDKKDTLVGEDEPVVAPVKEKEQQGLAAMMQKETSPSQKK